MSGASPADVDRMAGVVGAALATFRPLFPENDLDWWGNPVRPQEKIARLSVFTQDAPTDEDRALVGIPEPRGLYGLHDPARDLILVFVDYTLADRMDPARVLLHELGHAIYDNPDHPTPTTDASFAASSAFGSSPEPTFSDDCPVCNLFDRCAAAYGLLLMLDVRAMLYHRIPPGWGGTIPLARYRLRQAQALLPVAGPLIPDQWMVGELESRLAEAQWALQGHLDVEALEPVTAFLYRALDGAADVNGSFWSHQHLLRSAA